MKRSTLVKVLLWASAMAFAPQANAQTADKPVEPPTDAPSPDSVETAVPAEEANITAADARAAELEAKIEALQAQLTELKTAVTKATPSWKGAPQFADTDEGWSFKVRGRLMIDSAYAPAPDNYVANRNLGFNTRVRRFRIGVEGAIPGGFGYKAEADFANAAVGFGDVVISYAPTGKIYGFTFGNQESLDGMEQITSSRWSQFIERAQGNDAFGNTRRIGLALNLHSKDNLLRLDAGVFAAHSIDASVDNDGYILAARTSYTPYVGKGFVHMGLNFQHREFQRNDNGVASVSTGAPSTNQIARYRARPFLQTTDVRYVDTGNFAAKSDNIYGAELYGVFKSLIIGGEAQYVKVNAYKAGDIRTGLDAFNGGSVVTPTGNPSFFSGFIEASYFLTGETRGYKNGLWDRTKVLHPVSKGGLGAFQVAARFDYLDLDDSKLKNGVTNNFATGATTAAPASALGRGGKQTGYLFGLTWIPQDYLRFLVNYIHTEVEGGPLAATVKPLSTAPIDKRKYGTDAIAIRASIDW